MKMILLFRFLTKKPKTVRQEFRQRLQVVLFSFVLLISIVVFPDKETFAANAVVLGDESLDVVSAEGLTFNPSLSQPSTLDNTGVPQAGTAPYPKGGSNFKTGSSGYNNVVTIADNSQQYLSSLVNINAAGSIVPVLINIVVNINSKVDNLSNTNNVDLKNFYGFGVQ